MNDNIKKLYDELKGGGADVGSPDEFNNWLSAKGEQGYKNRLSVYNELKNGGADVGSYDDFRDWMGFRAVKPSKPTSQTVAPKPAPAKPAQQSKPKGTPMTEAERQNMLNGISGMVAQSKAGLQRTKNRMNYAKANTGLRVPGVTLGVKGGGVHLGQNSKVVETKPQYNAESGKVERSYLTESGNEYVERGGADLEQNAIDEARFQSEQQEAYLLREKQRIEQEMNQRGRELDAEAVDFSWRDMPRGSGGAIHTYNSSTVNGRFADAKYKSLLAQLNKVNDGLATLAEAKKGKASDQWIDDSSNWASKKGKQLLAFGAGAWRGLAHAVGKVSTWDMGMTDMATYGALYTAAVDADRKGIDNISREDRDLLDITAYTNAIQSENEQYLGRGYKAGQVTGESLPFMIEMMLNPASKLGTTATNKLMREAVKRYGKDAVKKATKKYLAAKIGTRLMGDAVGSMAMAGTTGQGHVTADMLNRLTGDVQFKVDDSGKIVYGGREGAEDSVLKAYMKAFGAQTIENHSEMVGEYFAPFLGKAASLTRKGMDKIGLGKVNKLIDDIGATNAAKMLGDFEKQTKWNGTFGEYAEEVVGNIENAILVGDNTLDTAKGTGVFNADQNIDTFLGVSLMGGFFAGAKTLSYRGPKRQALNEMSDAGKVIDNAIGDNVPIMEKWGGWRNTFLVGTDEEKKAALREVMDNTDLPIKFRMGVLNFVKAAQKYEGIVRAQESKVKDGEQDPVAQSSDESYDNGYDTTEPEAMNDAKNMYDYKRQQMSAMVTDEFLENFDIDPVGTLSRVMGRDDFSEDEKQLALDYVNAKATYDGMIDRVRDDIDSRIEESNATVNSRTNRNDGMIHPATLKLDDRKVYIVDGTIKMQDDGSMVDVSNSSESILVRDAETGKLEFMSPSDVLSTDESIDPATEKEAAQQALREQYAQEQSDRIDGVLAFNVGDTYDLTDEHGQQWSAQIVADNGDGTVQVAWNGDPNIISTAHKDVLQSMRDIHNRARINDYEQQRAAQRQEQQAEAAEPQRRTYNLNDEITLRDEEGNPVRGSITAEENEDGEIEVYTEQPINGKQVQLLRRDELDNMLLEQNGEVVENVPSEETPSVINLTDDESDDNAGTPVTAEEGAEGATLEPASATPEEQHTKEDQHTEPMPMIGEGEDAEPDFASVTPQRAHEYIFNESGLDEEDAKDFMTNNLRAAETAVTKIKNNKPKMGTSIAKFNKNKAEWQRKLDEANANLDYWQQVKAERNAVLAERAKAQQEADKKQTEKAQAAEAAYREEMAKKEAEQAALGTNTVSPAIRDKWNAAPKVEGAQNEIVLANGEKVAGRYYLVESGAATPSHNSANGFAKSEGFPVDENGGSVNDRDYERDKDAQQITRDIANKYDSRAMQTPVVVSQDGVVLSGNGRTMAGELAAAQGTDAEYNEHLAKYPTQYGFTSEQVKGMQHPRVVFVPDAAMPYTADTFAKFNQQEMKGQSKTEHSVKLGKVVDDETFNRIISLINRFDTLGDFYADFAASREAIGELFKCGAISRPQMAEMIDGDGLSAIGKETLENMLIGKAFESNPDAVREATEFKQMRQTIIQALAEISNNISLGKDYSLKSELAEAIDLVYNARKSGFKAGDRVSSYARQQQFDFYGVPSTVADYKNATMLMIADILNDNRSTLLKKYLQLYNTNAKDAANGQLDIFSGTVASKESILNDINELLNYGTEEEQKKAAQEAVEKRKAESVAEAGVVDDGSEGSNEDNNRIEETPAEQAPTEEEGSKPVMSHDEKMAFMRQFLEDTAGDMRLLDVVTDEEMQKLIDLYDAWEVVNDGLGAAHDANDALLNDKNKAIAQKAKENIDTAENAANAAFAPVEDYYNELLNTHNIEDEEGDADETETPSAETPLSDAISAEQPIVGGSLSSDGKDTEKDSSDQENGVKSFKITPKEYTTKRGKNLSMHLVTFESELTKEQMNAAKKLAKDAKGWWSKEDGGFLMRDMESAQKLADSVLDDADAVADAQPVSLIDMQEATGAEVKKPKDSGNKLVTDERYAELKARMRKKLGQLNVGVDPEMLAIGTEMAVYHIEKGARKFTEYAKAMIEDLGDAIRPYLKAFYNGARDLPEVEANGWSEDLTPYDEVRTIDIANFDKPSVDAMATAEMVVKEQEAEQQAEETKKQISETRNKNRNETKQQTAADTQAITSEATAIASETESVIRTGEENAINEQVGKIDEALDKVNNQLALLGYYEADEEEKDYNEATGYMRNAERKAVKDAGNLASRLIDDLGLDRFEATHSDKTDKKGNRKTKPLASANIAPVGGDVSVRLPLEKGRELYLTIGLEPRAAKGVEGYDGSNLEVTRIVYRVENPNGTERYGNNKWVAEDITYADLLKGIQYEARDYLPKRNDTTAKKPKASKKVKQEPQIGDLFASLSDNNVESNEETNVQARSSKEGGEGQQRQQDAQMGGSAGNEAERTDGRGMGGRDSRNTKSDGTGSKGLSRPSESKQGVTPAEKKNVNNNHAERGKDYAPKGADARIDANIKAIELMQKLMQEGKQATPAQMKVLRQFSGWGGLGKAFVEKEDWSNPTAKRLKELLGDEAYAQAELSRNSAYYTPASVIDTMWDIARALGFKGGKVLEGSAGIGNIIGAMPTDMSERSNIQAVEVDETTGNILSLLYPDAKVDVQGFEATRVPNGSVDLAITNVPFVAGMRVKDETGDSDLAKKFYIQDFCIAKNVRKLREGGIGIFITSNGTLDSSQKLRNWLVNEGNADVIGAFRLNNQTFGGTGTTSDIIVIRKRVNGKKSANAIDVSTVSAERAATFEDPKTDKERTVSMDYNKYFIEHPECMAGEMRFGFENKDFYRPTSKALYPVKGKNQNEMLAAWMKTFKGIKEYAVSETTPTSSESVYEDLGDDVKEGSLVLDKDDKLCIAQYGKAVPLAVNANKVKGTTKAECFRRYQAIKGALADVLSYQTENESDNGLQPLLDKLNDAFDNFVKTYGHLHKNTSISFLKNDVDFPTILALEKYSEVGDKNGKKVEKYDKTDIFSQRVVEKEKAPDPKNVKDGIIASIYQYGRIDVPYIADKLGKSEEDVKKEIVEKGLGYENPATMQMEVSYEYLSGNVREKLKQAEEANTDGKYSANVEALRKVIPMDIPSHLIEFTLGSSWVDPKLYTDYIKERTDVDVQLTNVGGTWFMKTPYYTSYEKNKAMGVRGQVVQKLILGTDLIEAALQNKTITVSETHTVGYGSSKTTETITDKEATQACSAKIDEIRADFKEWARQKMQNDADMSERIERTYNEQFNNYVPLTISDEFVPEYFGGANHKFKMRPHQAKAIIRGTMQPLLLAHEVGTGKTFTLISTAMEMRRLGTAKKPMIVVQNATVGQFVASAKELYPNAKVLTLEDKDRDKEGRKNFYAKIKYNDWDMIVVPQSVFERIPDSEERQMRFIQDKIDEKMMVLEQMREADSDNDRNPIIRQAEKEIEKCKDEMGALAEALAGKRKQRDGKKEAVAKQNASVKAKEMLDRQTDDVEDFDDMGIDALLVDEAHEYKHLGFATAMQRGVKGIDPSFSKKSQGVYLKTQAVLEKNNGRNVIFATGTPISNTAAEIWTFMRYLMPADTMKAYDIYYFDDFVRNFGNLTQMLEFKTNAKFQEVNRFAGYVNLPELVRIWSSVADTVRTDEAKAVKDNVPDIEGGQAQDIYLPQTRALRSIMKFVKEQLNEYDKMSGKEKKENSHIPLTMYGIAKAAAVDARLVMADAEDDKNSKTNEAVRQTLRSLKETAKYNGTVALFADNYQNKHSGFNLYEDIRKKLIEQGVPAEQVVIIRSGMSIKKKQEIFDKVNRGEIRVIMGSTFTLGTGVNIQERLHTLIHLDAPNRPMDYTQRNGRIARQGNLHKVMGIPIRILRFGVQDSLDVTAYQRLKTKGAIADSIMKGKSMLQNSMEDRSMEEDEDVFGDTVAQLSGSQYAMLKNQAEREVRKYESKKKQWEADQTYVHNAIPRINRDIERAEERAATAQQQLDAIAAAFGENATPTIKVGKKTYADINAMSDLFVDLNKKVNETAEEMRKSSGEDMRTRKVDVQIGDVTFTITTTQKKELVNHYGAVDTKISRSITYSCPELGLENEKGGAWFKNAIEDIFENVVSGDSFREELTRNTNLAERMKGELEQVKSREGQPFQYDKELSEAYEHLEEYTELMKKELEEKEQKYAEMDSEVEAATGVTEADEADEDTDDDKRFRDSLPDATAEDKDLRYSLREQTAPKHTKTAYAVFIVKQHEDGSVTLHPKMIADEAVGAPPHTWLNADTGKIKRDKQGEPIQNTRGRVSVRDAKGAPLAWRPGKHLAAYPNASQFAVEGDTKGVRDRLPDNVVFFEVEYAADRDYQLEAWEYGVNGNGKYEHSQAGLPYIPKDGYYIYRTNANPNIPAMIITGAYRVKRALTDEEAKKLNQEAGGDWYDRKSGEPMTAERLKELGLDEAGLQRKAETFDYNELEPAHDESSIAMSMPGYVRRDLDFTDKNLLKAIKENKQDASYYQSLYKQQKKDERQREQTAFEDGQVLPIELDWRNGGYKVEGLNAIFANKDRLLDAFRTKYDSYVATFTSDGNAIEVSPWRSVLAETKKPRRRNGNPTKKEQAKAAFIERETRRAVESVSDVAKKLGLNVEVKTDTEGLTGRRARAKGWYDTKTGKIVIILPNHTSGQDVMRTILHEGVAHHGLRELFGEDFDTFLENVYNNASKEIREAINRLAAKNDWDFKVATEEYLAGMAEDTNFDRAEYQSWWGKIKFLFLDMLRKAGLVLNRTLTDADLRYILWRSYRNLNDKAENSIIREAEDISMQMDLKVGNFAETDNSVASVADGDSYMYRDGDVMDERDRAIVRDRYERTIQSGMYQFREAVQDSMLSLRRLMEYIAEATGEKVKDFENAYMAENALSSKNHAEQDIYGKLLFNPMLDEIHNLAKENSSRDEVTRYMMAKHGLERNEVMARRAAEQTAMDELGKDLRAAERAVQNDPLDQDALDALDDVKQRMQDRVDELYKENRERDYGGITGLMGEDDLATAESLAKQFVLTFEGDHDVDQLWGRVNACTKATLEKTYKAGLLSKAGFDEINSMYEYYIPLRGFDATTSDEVYSYLTHEKSGFSSPLKKAEGRKSMADDPIATIANMADCAIVQGNRNMMKQKFLKFAMNHPSDAVSVNKMWLRYDDVQDQWEAVTANIDENDSADDVLAKTEAFEEQMRQLAEADPDHYKRGKDAANIPYIALGKNLNEHQVHVKMGGEDYILTINGSPRVAQALNGLTNPDNENAGGIGELIKAGEYINRQMSAFYTTRNPEFVLSNFLRDAMYANSTMWVRETPNYAIKFNKNFLKCNPAMLYKLLQKHNSGTLDMNNEMERAFHQFMMNGGETGYTVVKDIEKQKKLIKKYVRMKDASIPVEAAWKLLGDKLDDINRSVENCARFAAYLTSRQMGRSVERSVWDAKEVSVNFNKKGAGAKFLNKTGQGKWYSLGNQGARISGIGRSFYVFWNAAVQGTTNFASLHKHHTAKALAMDAGLFLLGAMLAGIGGGDDDDYWNLPSYVRRSNICFKIPGTKRFCSIPLGIEQRAIYGLGELFSSVASGKERMSGKEIAKEIAGSLSSMMPLDMMEDGSSFMPSYIKPFTEAYISNKDWKGMPIYRKTPYNEDDPEWTKASKRTNQLVVDFSKWCNEVTGGDDVKRGWANWNPSKLEHLFEGVFGGISTTANKMVKAGEMVAGKQDFDWSNILLASRVIKSGDENAAAKRYNAEYWKYCGEYRETKRLVDHYENQDSEGIIGAAEKLDFMYNSPEYGRYEIVDEYYYDVKELSDELKETTDDQERKELEAEINTLKQEMVMRIRAFDDARKK